MARVSGVLDRLFRIDGKVALVTDSGNLASLDVAPLLAEAGATVVIADKAIEQARAAAQAIDPDGRRAAAIDCDIESEVAVAQLFEQMRARFGRCDILANCAGLTANASLTETSLDQYEAMHSVNQRATFLLMRDAVKLMREVGKGGRIVNITTIGALHPVLHGNAGYGATRAAVTAMTRAIAYDHAADDILANLVMPGSVRGKTRFHPDLQARLAAGQGLSGAAVDIERRLPLGMGNGEEIAAAVLYLVGPAGRYITGQSLVLDGGFLIT
jgi:NAD(P)-dependent dehydrogenase (short-subunit alcohol dehydrogenase family)